MDRKNFKILSKSDARGFSLLLSNKNRNDCCILESNIIASLNESDTGKIKGLYTKLVDCFACIGIMEWSNGSKYLVVVTVAEWITKLNETDIFKINGVQFIDMSGKPSDLDADLANIVKLLESGIFFFGKGSKGKAVDISVNIQNSFLGKTIDHRFVWNKYLISSFVNFGISNEWYNGIICGGFQANTIYSSSGHIKICVISRLSCQRVGTRFQTRGIDDNGNVANFIETEQCFINSDGSLITSFIQVRGSVPLFWEQPGLQVGSHKIKFSRNLEMSSIAYEKHFNALRAEYNRVLIINLLGSKEGEHMLSSRYINCHKESLQKSDIQLISFDYHREMSSRNSTNINHLKSKIAEYIEESHFCWVVNGELVQKQYGVVRTNCVDCLDRTNAVQTVIGCDMLVEKQLQIMIQQQKNQKLQSVLENFRAMWKQNGDHVSQIYAGSGALGVGSKLIDAQKSVRRTYQATFTDMSKQSAMLHLMRPNWQSRDEWFRANQLLNTDLVGALDRRVITEMMSDRRRICDVRPLRVFVGTWNVNGGKNFHSIAHKHESVTDWLLDLLAITREERLELIQAQFGSASQQGDPLTLPMDIFAIGFEEIVDLTASNIMNAKSANQHQWARYLLQNISQRGTDYVMISTIQLVGICLFVFIRTSLAPFVTDVSTSSVKTGFKGTAGNKGAVAVRLQLYNSSFCFVCSHFAAGQSNWKERNDDYHDIVRQMRFSRDRGLWSHDFVFWCGDFNYRIDMSNRDVKQAIAVANWDLLEQADQLHCQRTQGNVFKNFQEGRTLFAPTYKYDIFCDDYDTSEKCRVPAWTDRVLWRVFGAEPDVSTFCRQLVYNRAELKTSDHRPVAAIFDVDAFQINRNCEEFVLQSMLHIGPRNGIVRVQVHDFQTSSDIPNDVLHSMIALFGEVGQIVLVRFSDSDVLFNYYDSKYVLEAIKAFDGTTLPDTDFVISVKPYDESWQDDMRKLVKDSEIFQEICYTPLLTELLRDTKNRQSVLNKEEFFNDDDDDLKVEDDCTHSRARSCSPPKEMKKTTNYLKPFNLNEQTNSCSNLVDKSTMEISAPKRPPPLRPPPINKSDVNLSEIKPHQIDTEEDLLGLFKESKISSTTTNPNYNFYDQSTGSTSLHAPLIPVKAKVDRPLPPLPTSTDTEAEIMQRALSRPLPQIPPPPVTNDIPQSAMRKKKSAE